jgi:hypothetical protein
LGLLSAREAMNANPVHTEPFPHAVEMDENLRDVLSKMILYDRKEIPVIDGNGILRGTIGHNDIHRCIAKIYFRNTKRE